jgi:probable rRNA maturation factor
VQIEIVWRVRARCADHGLLRRVAGHAAAAEGFARGQLSVAIVGARRMASLHRQYLGVDGPTDVLTFDLGCDRPHGRLEGEIVLCAAVARRQRAWRAELALYLVHGILHLAGYDDQTTSGARRMHARESELLRELGIACLPVESA